MYMCILYLSHHDKICIVLYHMHRRYKHTCTYMYMYLVGQFVLASHPATTHWWCLSHFWSSSTWPSGCGFLCWSSGHSFTWRLYSRFQDRRLGCTGTCTGDAWLNSSGWAFAGRKILYNTYMYMYIMWRCTMECITQHWLPKYEAHYNATTDTCYVHVHVYESNTHSPHHSLIHQSVQWFVSGLQWFLVVNGMALEYLRYPMAWTRLKCVVL